MNEKTLTRRSFFLGAAAAAATPAVAQAMMTATGVDENLSVFISDIHISGENVKGRWGVQPTYQNPLLAKAVEEILAMRPRPKRVVCFGDIALWFGHDADYAAAKSLLQPIGDAGIELHLAMGNHDHRDSFLRAFPAYGKASSVPGRIVSVVDLGAADLLLLDSLQEAPGGAGAGNPVPGAIDRAQWDWLREEAKRRTRPFFCGAHHSPKEMTQTIDGKQANVLSLFRDTPLFSGWIMGHDHSWSKTYFMQDWGSRRLYRMAVLPSTGWWGDIGYAAMRTFPDRAELSLVQRDFFFPRPLAKDEKRPRAWDEVIAENRGQVCTFVY